MDNPKNNKGLYIVVGVLCVLVLLLGGYIVYDKVLSNSSNDGNTSTINDNNQSNGNVTDNTSEDTTNSVKTKENLTSSELTELNTYFNEIVNSQMAFVIFDNPSKLLEKDNGHNYSYLTYIISRSKYAEDLKQEHVPSYSITLSGIKSILKDLTNYDYSEDEIKNYFSSSYNAEKDAYVILGGGAGMVGTITNSYKIGNNYYITLSNKSNVVLEKINGSYYFYSSTGTGE